MATSWRRAYRGGPPLYLVVLIVLAVLLATGVIPSSWLIGAARATGIPPARDAVVKGSTPQPTRATGLTKTKIVESVALADGFGGYLYVHHQWGAMGSFDNWVKRCWIVYTYHGWAVAGTSDKGSLHFQLTECIPKLDNGGVWQPHAGLLHDTSRDGWVQKLQFDDAPTIGTLRSHHVPLNVYNVLVTNNTRLF